MKKKKPDSANIDRLAQPVAKGQPPMRDPFKVHPGALKYEITDRIREIAFLKYPRKYRKPRDPEKVSKAALKFVGTHFFIHLRNIKFILLRDIVL